MPFSALSPLAVAVFDVLQDPTLLASVGGVYDDVPQQPTYPFIWYELFSERNLGSLGTHEVWEIELRTHVFSQYGGKVEAQNVNRQIVGLLRNAPLTVTGYRQCGLVFKDNTELLADEVLNGVKVIEIVSIFRVYVEE